MTRLARYLKASGMSVSMDCEDSEVEVDEVYEEPASPQRSATPQRSAGGTSDYWMGDGLPTEGWS